MPRSFHNRSRWRLALLALALMSPLLVVGYRADAQKRSGVQSRNTKAAPGVSEPQKKNLTRLTSSDTPEGSSITIVSNSPLNDYEAKRGGDRFYVTIPGADASLLVNGLRGRGFADVRAEKRGNDVLISFRLLAGATARVSLKFNRLEILITVPALVAANANSNSASSNAVPGSPTNSSGGTGNTSGNSSRRRRSRLYSTANTGNGSSEGAAGKSFRNRHGIEMVWIPPGSFDIGSNNGEAAEKPVHGVTISQGFFMGKYEVTQAQWQAVMGANPSNFKGDNLPVENVSWEDAQNFINKLNDMNDGYRYRLPTEAEWEYACRAGTTTEFSFGSSLSSDQANFDGNYPYGGAAKGVYRQKTTWVGSFPPNAFGLFDMHGNVWEWCEDWYHGSYAGAPSDGSAWLSGGEQTSRVLRGGSWTFNASNLRSALRNDNSPNFRNDTYGFRLVALERTLHSRNRREGSRRVHVREARARFGDTGDSILKSTWTGQLVRLYGRTVAQTTCSRVGTTRS